MLIQIKRIYDPADSTDGFRVLVDRLWPRGLRKQDAAVDAWAKELAPSTKLRKWFGHAEARFAEFANGYRAELEGRSEQLDELIESSKGRTITLLYSAKNEKLNQAVVLKECLKRRVR